MKRGQFACGDMRKITVTRGGQQTDDPSGVRFELFGRRCAGSCAIFCSSTGQKFAAQGPDWALRRDQTGAADSHEPWAGTVFRWVRDSDRSIAPPVHVREFEAREKAWIRIDGH